MASPQRKAIQPKTLYTVSRDIQPPSLLEGHRRLARNIGVSYAEWRFAQGHPRHLNLLAIRYSDVRTIADASSGAKSTLIGHIRLLEFFDGCGATHRRECSKNLCLQNYEVSAPSVCSTFANCFHVPLRLHVRAYGDDLRHE